MITIDGSHGEGGGQLARMSCALSALTGRPVRLVNVRAHRAPPGLAPQHLAAVRAVAQLCNAETEGLVFLPLLQRLGLDVRVTLLRRGYYPRGGGEVEVRVQPGRPAPLALETPGALQELAGIAHVANLPAHIVERMQHTAVQILAEYGRVRIEPQRLGHAGAIGAGGAIVLWARLANTLLGGSEVAQRGIPAERIAEHAAHALSEELRAGVAIDIHAADQLLIYLALAGRPAHFTARAYTSHAQTTAWLIEQFLPVRVTAGPAGAGQRIAVTPC
jgi:RNA 3'-phosphate cyclase